jgi:hypothetical protein
MRRMSAAAGAVSACLLVLAGGASTAEGVSCSFTASRSIPQGQPYTWSATVSSPSGFAKEVEFRLNKVGAPASRAVTFERQLMVVPPGATAKHTRTVTPSQWFGQLGAYQIVALVDGQPIGEPMVFEVTKPRVQPALFADRTLKLGLKTSVPANSLETCPRFAAGAAWGDIDGDRRLDLFLPRGDLTPQLFVNGGSSGFREEAAARGVAARVGFQMGAVFVDIDSDGDSDLYVTADGPNVLYLNYGKGAFTDATAKLGLGAGNINHSSASFADYDNDGRLDVYVATYGACNVDRVAGGQRDQLFHQKPDGTFEDVSALVTPDRSLEPQYPTEGLGFQAAWFDYNADGRQDIYVANDFLGPRPDHNRLWRNDGPAPDGTWHFTDVSIDSGTAFAMNTMGIGVGDYNRDSRLDLALSNIAGNKVLRNNGDGTFSDVSGKANAQVAFQRSGRPTITWGTLFHDFNLDGWEDLYIAAGYIADRSLAEDFVQHNQVLMNRRGFFLDLSAVTGADDPHQSRGVASADYDRDGRVDLYVVDQVGVQNGRPHLFRNVTQKLGHWLEVNAVGTRSNRDGCGAKLTAQVNKARLVRVVFCGSVSLSSGSDKVVHFGLGAAKTVPTLTIEWPSGTRQILRNVRTDRLITVREPEA